MTCKQDIMYPGAWVTHWLIHSPNRVFFAKNMLDLQDEFVRNNVNGFIDIGFHYTMNSNLANIRNHGRVFYRL